MPNPRFLAFNGPTQTTAAPAPVTTGAVIKTLLQLAPASTQVLEIVEWGISFDGIAVTLPIRCELIETNGAATVTAYAAASADFTPFGQVVGTLGSNVQVGTTTSGYTASGEGTPGVTRTLDLQMVSPTASYVKQFPLGERPVVGYSAVASPIQKYLRIRVTASIAVNTYCYVIWSE